MEMVSPLIHVGTIIGVHGVRGYVKIKSFTTTPQDILSYGPLTNMAGTQVYDLEIKHFNKDILVAVFKGVETREAAELLKGTQLYVNREAFPEADPDEFYYADLVDLPVFTEEGRSVGIVREVQNFGAGDFLVIYDKDTRTEYTIPFTQEAVPTVDIKAGKLVVHEAFLINDDGTRPHG